MKDGSKPIEAAATVTHDPQISTVSGYRAARLVGVTLRTITRWVHEGRLTAEVTPTGWKRIPKSEVLAAAARYRDRTPQADAAQRRAALETAIFEMFAKKIPLVQIVAQLGVPVAYVRELYAVYVAGLPYEHPETARARMPAAKSLEEHDAEKKRLEEEHESEIAAAELEMKKRQERLEKEHRETLEAHRAVLEGREPAKRRGAR